MLMLAESEFGHKNSILLSFSLNVNLIWVEKIANIVACQQAKVLLYHNQQHGFVFLPLWPQVNISFGVETAWTTVVHKDKFNFLVTFADILQLQIFKPFLIEIFKGSWKLKKSLQYLKYELRDDILNLDKFVARKRGPPCKISLNLRVLMSSRSGYLSCT